MKPLSLSMNLSFAAPSGPNPISCIGHLIPPLPMRFAIPCVFRMLLFFVLALDAVHIFWAHLRRSCVFATFLLPLDVFRDMLPPCCNTLFLVSALFYSFVRESASVCATIFKDHRSLAISAALFATSVFDGLPSTVVDRMCVPRGKCHRALCHRINKHCQKWENGEAF